MVSGLKGDVTRLINSIGGGLQHGVLEPHIVRHFRSGHGLTVAGEHLGRFPLPMLHMAVGERQVAALIMPVGGHVKPAVLPVLKKRRPLGRQPELGVKLRGGQLVNEHKQIAGAGCLDLGQRAEGGDMADFFIIGDVVQIMGITVDRLAHVVAAVAQLEQRLAVRRLHGGVVRRAMVDGRGMVVGEEDALFQVCGVQVCLRMIRAPGLAGDDGCAVGRAVRRHQRVVWGKKVAIVTGVEVGADLQLLQVAKAFGAACFILGLGDGWQQQRRQNPDDGDDDQQFKQRESAGENPPCAKACFLMAHNR